MKKTFAPLFIGMVAIAAWCGCGMVSVAHAQGASLYLGPATGSFSVGDIFTVSVYLNTGGQAVNAVEADLSFPPDKLQVVSPATGTSFIQIWVNQPSYSNRAGTLSFQGTVPTPGINAGAALLSTVTFRVVDTGTAVVKFLDTSHVLLNNGQGTDILSQTTDGIYTLTVPPPAGPSVTSPTHPDQGKWYQANSLVLAWELPEGAKGVSYVLDNSPATVPDDVSEGTATGISYDNLADGIYYFHIKVLEDGIWGGTTHFAIHIDATPPAAFTPNISPSSYTTNQDPVITFQTTDAESGVDHYELKFISLDLPAGSTASGTEPFFIEASSPYTQHLSLGRYNVVVRAYDVAGNFYQVSVPLTIVSPIFELVGAEGLRIEGNTVLSWPYVIAIAVFILLLLGYGIYRLWRLHRELEVRFERGAAAHPEIAQKLAELREKQREYEEALKRLAVILLVVGVSWAVGIHFARTAQAQSGTANAAAAAAASAATATAPPLALDPPIINLYPASLANDEVLYLGGWANVPNATVEIYIEQTETGNTYSGTATVGADGSWFYSFPQLLDSGHYVAWAELSSGNAVSPPSARVDVAVAPTAIQIGAARMSYEELYLILLLIFLAATLVLVILFLAYLRHIRILRSKLEADIQEAENSLRRGFSLLRKDIEREFAYIQKLKGERELSEAELARQEKVKQDLATVSDYIGREIWKIEEEERKLKL